MLTTLLLFKFLFFAPPPKEDIPSSIYDFKVASLDGGEIDFSQFRGKKILIVNTASKCGHTPQYKELEEIYQKYKDRLVVVGFPANNFLSQEPGSNEDIAIFCERNYGVSFPMAAKISVKGRNMAPIYQWLTNKDHNGVQNSSVKWNFQKYLISETGGLIAVFDPKTKPTDPQIINAIAP